MLQDKCEKSYHFIKIRGKQNKYTLMSRCRFRSEADEPRKRHQSKIERPTMS